VAAIGEALCSRAGTWPETDYPPERNGGDGYELLCARNGVLDALKKALRPVTSEDVAEFRSNDDEFWQALADAATEAHAA
jgi:hypothetical protein